MDIDTKKQRRRSRRLEDADKKRIETITSQFPDTLSHFGEDFTKDVDEAMESGGKLAKDHREIIGQRIKKSKIEGKTLVDVLPPPFVPHIEGRFKDKGISQQDTRMHHKENESYSGALMTSTYVDPPNSSEGEKEIPRPSSPRPEHLGSGKAHQTHTAPYSLGGIKTNETKTVWAQQWANIGIDTRVERGSLEEHKSGSEVVHFRMDTDKRSTVGYVSKRKSGEFSSMALQYRRRPDSNK